MKKILNKILFYPVLLFSVVGCNLNVDTSSTLTDEVTRIKNVYTDMVNDYTKNSSITKLSNLHALRKDTNDDDGGNVEEIESSNFIVNNELDLSTFCKNFLTLKDLVNDDFAKYCNQFNLLTIDEEQYYAKAQIYDETEQFALIIRHKNVYIFFSNFYFDEDLNKHLEKEDESYLLSFNAVVLAFTYDLDKVNYPLKIASCSFMGEDDTSGDQILIENEEQLESADVTNAYDSIKYPFKEHFYANEISALLNSNSVFIEDHNDFISLTEQEIYLSNKTGKFDIYGGNYHGELIDISVDENTINISNDYYNIFTYSPRVFLMEKVHLTLRVELLYCFRTYVGYKNEVYIYNEITYRQNLVFIISEYKEATVDGVRYKLKQSLDLLKPDFIEAEYDEHLYQEKEYKEEQLLEEVEHSAEYFNENIDATYISESTQYIYLVDLPRLD